MLSNDFRERYQRQLLLPQVGEKGQLLLAQKRVIVVGAGGLGCTLLPLLVGSGVGHLVICDNDVVSLSNLPRQTLYTVSQIGQSKAQLAAEHLRASNPDCDIKVYTERLVEENAHQFLDNCDLIIDATDNESTRRLLNRYAQAHPHRGSTSLWKVGKDKSHFSMDIILLTVIYFLLMSKATRPLLLLPSNPFR